MELKVMRLSGEELSLTVTEALWKLWAVGLGVGIGMCSLVCFADKSRALSKLARLWCQDVPSLGPIGPIGRIHFKVAKSKPQGPSQHFFNTLNLFKRLAHPLPAKLKEMWCLWHLYVCRIASSKTSRVCWWSILSSRMRSLQWSFPAWRNCWLVMSCKKCIPHCISQESVIQKGQPVKRELTREAHLSHKENRSMPYAFR